METNYDILINFTGGLDSTYALWDWLKNNPDKKCLVHHCVLINYQNRHKKESEAVKNILDYFRSQGFNNFDYIETTFDYGHNLGMINDIEVIGFMTATLLRNKKMNIPRVAITASVDDFTQRTYHIRAESRFRIIELVGRRNPEYVYPIKHLTRKEMLALLPDDLKKLIWFCRFPKEINDKESVPCGKCGTCRKTLHYLLDRTN